MAWLPVLKAALPYVSNIVAAAIPAFTQRKEQDPSNELVTQQIAELQSAVTSNAEAVKTLAAQVEKTLTAFDAGSAEMAQRLTEQLAQQFSLQLASLHENVAHCENVATQAQAQVTRLEAVAASLQMRMEEQELQFRQLQEKGRRRELGIAGALLIALLLATIALLR